MVTVILPVRNEADFIEHCLRSVCGQDYAAARMEILVVDGMSEDGTREIVLRLAKADGRIRLLDNPDRAVSTAMNLGIRIGAGELFTRVDGHAVLAPDFLRESVACLTAHADAWVVGGVIETVADGWLGEGIAAAMRSPVGVGNSRFRVGGHEGWVDTLAFGTHHRWIVDRIGYFDEELVRNQDDDFNQRIRMAGGKIWLSSAIRSQYYGRASLGKLWRQYFQYGFWRIRTLQKHGQPGAVRQLIPMAFTGTIAVLAVTGLFWGVAWWWLAGILAVYAAVLVAGAIHVGFVSGWRCAIVAPVAFAILHGSYGLGCLWGFLRFVVFQGAGVPKPAKHRLSR